MKSTLIRETFLNYFENNGHHRVKSSSLIPAADPTLLFTNAGMVQFKECFLGTVNLDYQRATTSQKCVRAGGKHNDLENVGFTARHHTFFEMLGNFSFGDYFKKDAIAFAWELLTRTLSLPKDRLRATVFETDDEAFQLWKAQGVRPDWITRMGEKDNFWAMGDTGPCGPCSEIHFDWGPEYGCPKTDCCPGCECGRFLEIWNLVFMQYDRDSSGQMNPLPKPSVDTGAGLERFAAVLQEKYSNYDTDLFSPLLTAIAHKVGKAYGEDENTSISMRVIADHLRSGSFLMADGVIPSNEGRGYVLRRILRRAIRHGKKLGESKPFIHQLVPDVVSLMGDFYPELIKNQKLIVDQFREEEERFHDTLHRGIGLLEETISKLNKSAQKILPGDIAFKLYDTYGFPLDLTEVICREYNLSVDQKGFDECMKKQRLQSVWSGGNRSQVMEDLSKTLQELNLETRFTGYGDSLCGRSKVKGLFSSEGKAVSRIQAPHTGYVLLDKTPFYAESGGQVGDSGNIQGNGMSARVLSTFKVSNKILHQIEIETGEIALQGHEYELKVNEQLRKKTTINHTATHLLHAALRSILGERVKQAGSLVDPGRLRFDFTFPKALSRDEITEIENLVNEIISSKHEVSTDEMGYEDAIKVGALAFFDEKYGNTVRVVHIRDHRGKPFSIELCGGTHLHNVADIQIFKLLSEGSIASGVRRIEAITSDKAFDFLREREQTLTDLENQLSAKGNDSFKKVEQLIGEIKSLKKEVSDLKIRLARGGASETGSGTALWDKSIQIGDLSVITEIVPEADNKILCTLVDQVRDKISKKTAVLLASHSQGKVSLCLGFTKDMAGRYHAGSIIQKLTKDIGGTGGGKPEFAQAGGTDPEKIPLVFENFKSLLKEGA